MISGAAMSLQEVLSTAAADPASWGATPSVVLENNDGAMFVVGDGTGCRIRLDQLRLIDTYDEVYLMARTIDTGMRQRYSNNSAYTSRRTGYRHETMLL